MDAAPDLGRTTAVARETLEAALRAGPGPHRSAGRTRMTGWQSKALLVAFVLVLGLIQGTRTALGSAPLERLPTAPDVAAPPALETDWRRGHFFRPAGSTASRPRLVLRPLVWRPAPAPSVARACTGPDRSC